MIKVRQFGLCAVLLSVCMLACQCDSDENDNNNNNEPQNQDPEVEVQKPEAGTYTFVLPDFAAKPAWVAGDQISLRGNYAPDAMTVTLKAGDISADGKTATVALSAVPPTFCPPDWLYAAYPAEAVVARHHKDCVPAYCRNGNKVPAHRARRSLECVYLHLVSERAKAADYVECCIGIAGGSGLAACAEAVGEEFHVPAEGGFESAVFFIAVCAENLHRHQEQAQNKHNFCYLCLIVH